MDWEGGGVPGGAGRGWLLWSAPGWLSCATADALPPIWSRHSGKKSPRPDGWVPGGQRSPLMSLERPDVSSRLRCCAWKETLAQEERPVRKGTLRKTPAPPPPYPDCGGLPQRPFRGGKSANVLREGGLPLTQPPLLPRMAHSHGRPFSDRWALSCQGALSPTLLRM